MHCEPPSAYPHENCCVGSLRICYLVLGMNSLTLCPVYQLTPCVLFTEHNVRHEQKKPDSALKTKIDFAHFEFPLSNLPTKTACFSKTDARETMVCVVFHVYKYCLNLC